MHRFALLILFSLLACNRAVVVAPQPKVPELVYNWQSSTLETLPTLRAGEVVAVRITHINAVCYDVELSVNEKAATENIADFLKLLGYEPPKAEAANALPAKVPAAAVPPRAAPPPNPPRQQLDYIEHFLRQAEVALAKAKADADALTASRKAASNALSGYYKTVCPANGQRGPVDLTTPWNAALPLLGAFVAKAKTDVPIVVDSLTAAKRELGAADALLLAFGASLASDATFQNYLRNTPLERERYQRFLILVPANRDIADKNAASIDAVRKDGETFNEATGAISGAIGKSELGRTVFLKKTTESIDVTITAKPKAGVPALSASIVDQIPFEVYRRHRFLLSAGVALSGLYEHDFQRVNLLDSLGKAYSTFTDRKENHGMAFSPALLSHFTLGRTGSVDWALSGGVATRSVADKTQPDYLVGSSVGINDVALLTIAYHAGRVEHLLLGPVADIKRKPVPDTITRTDAVGDRWGHALAIIMSFRLP